MAPREPARDVGDTGALDVAFVLLLLQAAFGYVAALGAIVLAVVAGFGGIAGLPLWLGVPTITLVIAIGVARCGRWSRRSALIFESLLLLGAALRMLVARGQGVGLVVLLTGVVIPLLVIALLMSRSARRAVRRRAALSAPAPERQTGLTASG